MLFQSQMISLDTKHKLHIMRIHKHTDQQGIPVLMVHGMIENGRIFYHKSGKGLACYLAKQGYDVYVADLRGIGESEPKINKHSAHGQTETIVNDIPAMIEHVLAQTQHNKLHLVAHSWGGVNLNACLLRFPALVDKILSGVYFGSKRRVRVRNFERFFKVELIWNNIGLLISRNRGYLPAKKLKLGAENETLKTHQQCIDWVKKDKWQDSDDNFDYALAAKKQTLPPIFYIAAVNDLSLGHQSDVKLFMNECGGHDNKYMLLGKNTGHQLDYDHINMLTAPEAEKDHFPSVLKWLISQEKSL